MMVGSIISRERQKVLGKVDNWKYDPIDLRILGYYKDE